MLPDVDDTYTWAPNLFIFGLSTWLDVPGESLATMDQLGIPRHQQDRVLCAAATRVLEHNSRIARARWPTCVAR